MIITLILIVLLAVGFGYFFLAGNNKQSLAESKLNLSPQVDNRAGISFTVKPINFDLESPVEFAIKADTHSGSLDFDLTLISVLQDDKGNEYQPLIWQGDPAGGHHLAGTLFFPKTNNQTKTIKLTIQDAYLRVFEWEL